MVDAVARLKACGFLDWIRRCVPIENAEPDVQQSEQISNAFILLQPPTVRECRKPPKKLAGEAGVLARYLGLRRSGPARPSRCGGACGTVDAI